MSKKSGGPAFPFAPAQQQQLPDGTWDQAFDPGEEGMSLREWFAGQALGPLITKYYGACGTGELARRAFEVADAMAAEALERRAQDDMAARECAAKQGGEA